MRLRGVPRSFDLRMLRDQEARMALDRKTDWIAYCDAEFMRFQDLSRIPKGRAGDKFSFCQEMIKPRFPRFPVPESNQQG